MSAAIGVDVGGTGIKGALVDTATGELLSPRCKIATPHPARPAAVADVVAQVIGQIREAVGDTTTPWPIGITLPAVVRDGVVETAANIDASWVGVVATDLLAKAGVVDAVVLNDADAAGLAEVRFGAGRGQQGVVLVATLGTGIGSAVLVDGTLVPNTELGHLLLKHGDAETWAAESARERENLSWRKWGHRLNHYFQYVESLLWPSLIIIGGGVSKESEKFLPLLELRTPVVPAQLRNNAGIVGAAMVAAERSATATVQGDA